jgi:hypothetical protein
VFEGLEMEHLQSKAFEDSVQLDVQQSLEPLEICVDRILVGNILLVCIGYPTCSNLVRLYVDYTLLQFRSENNQE